MRKTLFWSFIVVLLLSLSLTACGGSTAPEPAVEEPTEAPEVVVEEVEEPEEQAMEEVGFATEADLDAAFQAFLANMVKYNTIGIEDTNALLVEEPPPFLLDVREESEVSESGHIEGAVVIPLREVAQNIDYLASEGTTTISYCGSGWRCTIAMTALGALGWEDVLSLKGGSFGGWVEAGYPTVAGLPENVALNAANPDPAMLATIDAMLTALPEGWGVITAENLNQEMIENPDLVLIDVRRPEEVEANGSIEGSVAIPLESLIDLKSEWPADLDTPISIYCGSGHRSTIAMTIMNTYGYSEVTSLKDGFAAWTEAGFPVVGGEAALDTAVSEFLANMVAYNTIGIQDTNALLAEEPPPFLLDVREASELEEKGHIEGAVQIPLREVLQNVEYLPSEDTQTISYCGSGWRCTIAMTALGIAGWEDVLSLKGGSYGGWVEAGYPTVEGLPPEPVALNAANPNPALVSAMDEVLMNVPDGFGVITADDLNQAIIENPDLILIDVRRAEEVEENGEIEGSIQIPLESMIEVKDQWPAELEAPIAIYCGSGHRSTIAMTIMWAYGYDDVRSLKDGFSAWVDSGYPVVEAVAP